MYKSQVQLKRLNYLLGPDIEFSMAPDTDDPFMTTRRVKLFTLKTTGIRAGPVETISIDRQQ